MMVLEAAPNARFFPRLYLHAPQWWSEQHPDDLVRYDPGDGKPVLFLHSGNKPAPSWASDAWRRDTAAALRKLIAHVQSSPYADRVIGYHIASGTTEEWMMWGANENQWVDYSPVNVRKFRAWLKAKYETNERLQRAWNRRDVTFETAAIPTRKERERCLGGSLRRIPDEQPVVDFYLYNSDLVAETIAYFARTVKEAAGRDRIVGVFYGYLLQLCGEQRQQNAGHLALAKVLECPDVDFLCSPTSYAFRQLGGEGTSHFMSLLGSVQLHGKLWFDENDIRTSLSPGKPGQWGKPEDVAGDILQQDKELADVFVNGAAQWWFDVGRNRYDDPRLMERIALYVQRASQVVRLDRSPVDEIAFVVDERSLTYLRPADPLGRGLLLSQVPALRRIGAPARDYLASDLPRIRDRKLFIFPVSFAPTPEQVEAVQSLRGDGRILVFLYAPGIYGSDGFSEESMQKFTGLRLRIDDAPEVLRVTVREDADPLVRGHSGASWGQPTHRTRPIVYADDPEALVLGRLPNGRAGLVVRRFGTWTAVFSAAPGLPVWFLQRLADEAGVHRYIETEDVVWACRNLVAVSVHRPGRRTIRLPRRAAQVTDLWSGRTVAVDSDRFEAEFDARTTRVFVLH